jgi:hypothetical protein
MSDSSKYTTWHFFKPEGWIFDDWCKDRVKRFVGPRLPALLGQPGGPQPDPATGAAGCRRLEQSGHADALHRKGAGGEREAEEGVSKKKCIQEVLGAIIFLHPAEFMGKSRRKAL